MLQAGRQQRLLCRHIVGVVSVVGVAEARHGQDVRVHVDWHTLGVLHGTPPIQLCGPPWLADQAAAAGAGVGVHC